MAKRESLFDQVGDLYALIFLLVGVFALGLIRAWELFGVHRYGLFGWLNPLRDVNETESFSQAGTSHTATRHPKTDVDAPRSPSEDHGISSTPGLD